MSVETQELLAICERLPAADRAAVTSYARSPLASEADDLNNPDDARWEAILNDSRPRPKLDAFFQAALAEATEPLDLDKL